MRQTLNPIVLAAIAAGFGATLLAGSAEAAGYDNMASYNTPYGMAPGQETRTINPSMRDANGNLTIVNGQVTSSSVNPAKRRAERRRFGERHRIEWNGRDVRRRHRNRKFAERRDHRNEQHGNRDLDADKHWRPNSQCQHQRSLGREGKPLP